MVFVGAREERLAQNEALFREVNERVLEVAKHFIEVETKAKRSSSRVSAGAGTAQSGLG
jgi:hypothetical protein